MVEASSLLLEKDSDFWSLLMSSSGAFRGLDPLTGTGDDLENVHIAVCDRLVDVDGFGSKLLAKDEKRNWMLLGRSPGAVPEKLDLHLCFYEMMEVKSAIGRNISGSGRESTSVVRTINGVDAVGQLAIESRFPIVLI